MGLHLLRCTAYLSNYNYLQAILRENAAYKSFLDICPLKILGGVEADITQIPYQVALRQQNWYGVSWSSFCGGSLITLRYVLTAAHCFIFSE
ncbi:unnamed protein product [Pieris macdunnoughi]|uniref:Peptidase S1 domain-containing protein n=1 Tax=Pieris macdunnoughi TaxID=345717 RepID=A0A821YAE6_9NEOP|nr:unnamed protein product [Pieris macdunnoughi]